MADAVDTAVPDSEGPLSPEELEHKKLFDEFAARRREGAAPAASEASTELAKEGDDDESAEEPKVEIAEPAADKAATVGDKEPEASLEDIWANATPAQKAAHDAALANLQVFDQYKRSNEGRIASFQRRIDDLDKALAGRAAATTTVAATAADKKVDDVSKTLNDLLNDPEFLAAEKEYPDVYKPQRKVIGGLLAMVANVQSKAQALETELGSLKSTAENRFRRDDIRTEEQRITELDPDYVETVSRPEFKPAFDKWFSEQPRAVQKMINESAMDGVQNATDTSWAFRRFKQDTGFGAGQAPAAGSVPAAKASTSSATNQTRRALQIDSSASHRSPRVIATPNAKDGSGDTSDALWKQNVARIAKRNREQGIEF